MKELTREEWLKNPTPRMMWVWDDDETCKEKMKAIYWRSDNAMYPVIALSDNEAYIFRYKHCAEVPKKRRMTNKELSRWLREKPTREYKRFKSDDALISYYHNYIERTANEEIEDSVLIREDDGDWKEPLVEV